MELIFDANVILTVDIGDGSGTEANHVSTEFSLEIDDVLDRSMYFNENNTPNGSGSEMLSNVLVQGLIGNIHFAHGNGYRDSAEHLRWIISELEKGFAEVVEIDTVKH